MNFLQKIGLQIKAAAPGKLHDLSEAFNILKYWGTASWWAADFGTLMQQGYKGSSAVSACVRALAFSFPEPPLTVYRNTAKGLEPVENNHPLQMLIRRPNPDMGEAELMQFAITYCSTSGNLYLIKARNKAGQVVQLWPFSDQNVTPVPGETNKEGFVSYYEFDDGDGHKLYFDKKDVIHWKWMVDPEYPWRGIGAIESCLKDIQSDTESTRFAYAMFKNNAIPPFAVTLVEGEQLNEAVQERLEKAWLKKYGGNKGLPAFFEAGMTIQKLGLNMQELNLSELKNIPESRICAGFGVPPTIALLYVGLKRSDYGDGEARKSFTSTTLVALWRSFASELTSSLGREFGEELVLDFDLNRVRALQENITELWTRLFGAVDRGLITRADFKRGVGMKAEPGDEVYRTNLINGWEPANSKPSNPSAALDSGAKALPGPVEKKALIHANAVYGRALQRIRLSSTQPMIKELDSYFSSLSDRIISRAEKSLRVMAETKELPDADSLLTKKDEADLAKLLKRWYAGIAQASWETINLSLGVVIDFELTDPAISKMLASAGSEVRDISETTRSALQNALKYGNEQGWSIQELVRGDENQPGLRSIVEETYKNRSVTIARTELGNAQNSVTLNRYGTSGVDNVGVLDNGDTDDDDECKQANGQVWSRSYAENNPLEHPNCTRCFFPILEAVEPDQA